MTALFIFGLVVGRAAPREHGSVRRTRLMRLLLFLLSGVAVLLGVAAFTNAASAAHEIQGLILLLIAAVLVVGAAIVEAVNRVERELAAPRLAQEREGRRRTLGLDSPPVATPTAQCAKCGAYIRTDATNCDHCGAAEPFASTCQGCQKPISTKAFMCPHCGLMSPTAPRSLT
jgi:hypothetical protein